MITDCAYYTEVTGLTMDDGKLRVTAADFQRNVGRYQDVALTQPVTITKNGRDRTVLLSAEEFERLRRNERRAYSAGEVPDEIVEAIRRAEVPAEYNYLNEELKDWKP
jgi:prevent-host-death family protein